MEIDFYSLFITTAKVILVLSFIKTILFATQLKKFDKPLTLLSVHLIIAFVVNIGSYYLATIGHNNLFVLHFYNFYEVTYLSYIFYVLNEKIYKKNKITYIVLIGIVALVILISTYYLKRIININAVGTTLSSVTIIFLIISYLMFQLDKVQVANNMELLTRIIILTIFINHSVSLFIFLFSNRLMEEVGTNNQFAIWLIRNLVTLATEVFLIYSIWIKTIVNKPKSLTP